MVASTDGRFRLVNDAWTRLLGWTPEELTGRPWLDFIHPDDLDASAQHGVELRRPGHDMDAYSNRYRTKDGEYRWLNWRATTHELEDGELVIVGVARDVTHEVEMEEELRRREELLARLLHQQRRVRDEERARLCGELHDFAIQHNIAARMFLDLTLDSRQPAEEDDFLRKARSEVERSTIAMRRIMHGLEPADLLEDGLTSALELALQELEARHRVAIERHVVVTDEEISPESAMSAFRTVREAVSNAARHAQATHIGVDLQLEGEQLRGRVWDDGVGCDMDSLDPESGGMGIGLMRGQVLMLRGEFQIGPRVAGGTEVTFRIPASAPDPVGLATFSRER